MHNITNSHTHFDNSREKKTSVINIFAQDAFNYNFNKNKLYSIGLHPWHSNININFKELKDLISKNKNIVAIGEIGLDKTISIDIEQQLKVFKKQIEISIELNLPIIIHSVRAVNQIIKIKLESKSTKPWLYHDFNKNDIIANKLIENNFFLSFGKSFLNNNSKAISTLKKINTNKILFENDNSKILIIDVYNKASKILNIEINKLISTINFNFNIFYNI